VSDNKTTLLGGKLLAKNSIYSLIGMLLPMIAGLIAIPFLLTELGEDLFGLLILFWSTISYITVLDFGLNRAATKYFAQNIGMLNEKENLSLLLSSIIFVVIVGLVAGSVLFLCSDFLVSKIFEESSPISELAVSCFKLISYFSPILLLIPTISAFLRSYQNFKWLSIINSINGILNYAIPVIALIWSHTLFEIIQALLLVKVLIFIALFIVSIKLLRLSKISGVKLGFAKNIKKLVTFGGWVSVSNFLTPLFEYSDRFIIATYITVSAVAIYGTPLEVVLKVGMIAAAISGVLFAAISNSIEHDLKKTEKIINQGLNAITLLSYPIIVTLILFANEGLTWWVGEDISIKGTLILQIVAIGVLFKCSTNLSIAYLHSINKPKVTAITHIGEFVLYIISLAIMAKYFGILGVAAAHSGRLILDNILMSYFAQKYSQKMKLDFIKNSKIIFMLTLSSMPAFIFDSMTNKLVWWAILAFSYLWYVYKNHEEIKILVKKETK
jgi:O-antigen/teichoic acid export membrane protein